MDEAVDSSELITRYLRNSTHLRTGLGRPHFSAYMPREPDGNISVYRTSGLPAPDIVDLGNQYVGSANAPLKGHCDLVAAEFYSNGLNIEAAPNPHERHANVCGWVNDPKNRIIAKKLADLATLTVY